MRSDGRARPDALGGSVALVPGRDDDRPLARGREVDRDLRLLEREHVVPRPGDRRLAIAPEEGLVDRGRSAERRARDCRLGDRRCRCRRRGRRCATHRLRHRRSGPPQRRRRPPRRRATSAGASGREILSAAAHSGRRRPASRTTRIVGPATWRARRRRRHRMQPVARARCSEIRGGLSFRCAKTTDSSLSRSNGRAPARHSNSTHPSE